MPGLVSTFWMNNKTIIGFGFRMIWRIRQISLAIICFLHIIRSLVIAKGLTFLSVNSRHYQVWRYVLNNWASDVQTRQTDHYYAKRWQLLSWFGFMQLPQSCYTHFESSIQAVVTFVGGDEEVLALLWLLGPSSSIWSNCFSRSMIPTYNQAHERLVWGGSTQYFCRHTFHFESLILKQIDLYCKIIIII